MRIGIIQTKKSKSEDLLLFSESEMQLTNVPALPE